MPGQIECSCYLPLNGRNHKSRNILYVYNLLRIVATVAWPNVRSSTLGTQKPREYIRRDVPGPMNGVGADDSEPVSYNRLEPPLTLRLCR
jgi:hypothetical protein